MAIRQNNAVSYAAMLNTQQTQHSAANGSSADIIFKYFPALSARQQEQFAMLQSLYGKWNECVNLVSRKDIGYLYERHILHSLAIAKCDVFFPQSTALDVGCGGGFPSLPLAIMFPQTQFTMVDSIGKKISVLKNIVQTLKLHNAEPLQARAESLQRQFDFTLCRAVAAMPILLAWVWKITARAALFLKGGNLTEELAAVKEKVKIFDISAWFDEDFFETKKIIMVSRI